MTSSYADLCRYIEDERKRRAQGLRFTRFLLLRRLRLAGVSEAVCTYDAYGDSGNWEDVSLDGGRVMPPDDLQTAIGNFAWDVAYHVHPGFETDEGGCGDLTWDLIADSITLNHCDRFIETRHTCDEGI